MTQTNESKLESIIETLERPEQLESLHYLVEKLPEFTETIQAVEDKLDFVQSVLNDKQSLQSVSEEAEKKVAGLEIGQEHLDAMIEMAQMMPKIVPMVKKAEEVSAFVTDVLSDAESVEYVLKGVNDVVPLQKGIDIVAETNRRFQADTNTPNVSVLKMYRLLKDPVVQKGFKYIETMLDVVKEK